MGSIPIHILSSQEGGDLMAIVITLNDSIFDILNNLQNNGFEIIWIILNKQDKYYSIVITRDNLDVRIINFYSRVMMISSNKKRYVTSDKVLINDDLSFEAIK